MRSCQGNDGCSHMPVALCSHLDIGICVVIVALISPITDRCPCCILVFSPLSILHSDTQGFGGVPKPLKQEDSPSEASHLAYQASEVQLQHSHFYILTEQ